MDLTKVLYIIPPWKPTRSLNMKPSYLKIRAVFYDTNKTEWELFLSRDSMGLGWITLNLPADKYEEINMMKDIKYQIRDFDFNKDQVLRSWVVLNLCIRSRKGRINLMNQIIQRAVDWFIDNPTNRNICIPRMLVFKEDSKTLSFSYEMINGDNLNDVCSSVGAEKILNQPMYTSKGLFSSPVAFSTSKPTNHNLSLDEDEDEDEEDEEENYRITKKRPGSSFGGFTPDRPH